MAVGRQSVEAAGLGELSSPGAKGRRCWTVAEGCGREEEECPAVLSLSHFSRPPFLSFGSVRVGTSRLRRLAVENPNAEPVRVAVCRPPPASKGFSVEQQRGSVLQPGERIFISITWTPLEGGKIRELITFIVNDVVKHQAVLLGTAEQPVKKKRNLWDTIKKKTPSQRPQRKKRLPIIKNVNKTFQIPEKMDRGRSPLQSCENMEMNRGSISADENSLILSESKLSLSPISPIMQENQHITCTPGSVRSTTYSVLGTAACDELLKDIKETCSVMLLCDYLVGKKLESPHNVNSMGTHLSHTNSVCTPEQRLHTHLNHRRILSPDSFVSNSYELAEEPAAAAKVPILSPDQFLKENQIAIQPALQVHKSVFLSSNVDSSMSRTTFPRQKMEKTQVVTFSVDPKFSNKAFNDINNSKSATLKDDKFEEKISRFRKTGKDQTSYVQKELCRKKPVLSSTVTKSKPDPPNGKEMVLKAKSKRCLSNAIQQCVNTPEGTKLQILPRLPVIEPLSGEVKCLEDKTASACLEVASYSRKRKSQEYLIDPDNRSEAYGETVKTKKIQISSAENGNKIGLKTSLPKPMSREKRGQTKRSGSLSQKFKTAKRTKKIVPVSQSHLTFVKPLKTDIPRHPMPFVAKNMFFDERWKEKQQRGFTWWLNYVLTPDDFSVKTDISQVNAAFLMLGTESHHKSSVPKAPTKEEASLRAYTARCKLNKLRRSACHLFTCDEMVRAIKRLEIEIEAKRLLVRKDRHLWKDIGERQKILNWLLCYNPLWLRIGLETIYGELIPLESNSDVMGLAVFILSRLLWNPDIAAEYRHPSVPHLYRDGHEEALSKFTLKKLLLLICFLDRAKLSRIIEHDPCLFCKNAEFKSSKEILLAFSRDFLSGEGDLSRHLGFMGFPVNHVQTPLDEFDFAVTNLATDLQCGIRLVRALELLSKNWSLSKKLRVPAISRLQKIHNVNIVLEVLKDHGIQLKDEHSGTIEAKDIVDRHREKTFALLWKIVFAFQVDVSLDVIQLKEETDILKNMYISKGKGVSLESSVVKQVRKDSSSNSFYSSESYSGNIKLLMIWVNAVCQFYNVKVENFTVSFSDGRVLCYLIHHYHPCYIPLDAICQRTTQTVECTKSGTLALNSSSESEGSLNLLSETFDQAVTTSMLYKELLDNEKRNFQLINAAVSNLGGIPSMIHHSDMSNTIPDEKVVITYLSYLCSRLLELSKEIRAAQLIQSAWRERRLKTKLAQTKSAAVVIQKYWRRCLAKMELEKLKKAKQEEAIKGWHEAAAVLQAWYKMKKARKHFLKMSKAALVIQIHYRAYREQTTQRLKFLQMKKAAVCLQAGYRGYKLRKMLRCQYAAAVKIQAAFRAYTAKTKYQALIQASRTIQKWYRASRMRRQFLKTKALVTSLQAALRGWQVRKWFLEQRAAAVIIQTAFRRYEARKRFIMTRGAVLILQQHYRAKRSSRKQHQEYIVLRSSIIQLQAAWRGNLVRKQFQRQLQAAVVIQSFYRMHVNHTKFKRFRGAVITVQRWYRAIVLTHRKRQEYLSLREAAVKIQAFYRGGKARRKIQHMDQAAVRIQAMFKMHQCNVTYQAMKLSAVIIQRRYRAFCRGRKERRNYLQIKKSSLILQAAYRGMKVRQELKILHQSATSLQSFYRMYRQQKSFQKLVAAAKLIQQWYRGCKGRNVQMHKYRQIKMSALRIQSAFRGMKARHHLQKMHRAATTIQRLFRTFLQRKSFLSLKAAALTIQRKYRATVLSKQQHEEYLHLRKTAIIVQSTIRGQLTRKSVKQMQRAATVIQAAFRMHMAYTQYQALKLATIRIQRQYRAYQETKCVRGLYLKQRHSALVLQAAFRGMKMRWVFKKQHDAAIIIQSNYRRHRQQCSYKQMQWAARVIQGRVRANMLSKIAVQQYFCVKTATVCIQRAFRKMKATQYQRHQAALVLQRNFKMQRERRRYLALKAATVLLQRWYRSLILGRRQVRKYASVYAAIVCVQSFFRGFKVRKQIKHMHSAARIIQASFRRHRARVKYQRLRYAAIIIQTYYRTYVKLKHQQSSVMQKSIVTQVFDSDMKRKQELAAMHIAATLIQSFYRMHVQHKHYRLIQWAVITIQSAYRGMVVRRKTKKAHSAMAPLFSMVVDCKKSVQFVTEATVLHGLCYTEQYQKYRKAATLIQQHYRSYLTMKHQRAAYLQTLKRIIIAQAAVRGFIERQRFCRMKRSVIKIQAFLRGCKARQLAIEMIAARNRTTVIPTWLHRSRTTKEYRAIERATHVIQRYQKAKQQRIWFLRMKVSTVLIQRKWRATRAAKMARQKFLAIKVSVQIIQFAYRKYCARKQLQKILVQRRQNVLLHFTAAAYHHLAAVKIQRAYRNHLHLKHVYLQLSSVLYIQQWYRAKKQRIRYLQYREKIIKIQRNVRRWISDRKKSAVQEHKNPQTLSNGIIKFQALWRGYSWRKKTDTAETRALRDSLIIANKESKEEKKLCNRTALAIDRLLKYKHFSYILAALKELEVVTRLSPVCCESISQTEAVCTIFTLIRSCNRSVPCMDVITYSVQVLLNLSKYERTTEAVYAVEKSVDTLLDLLQMYREKAGGKISEKGGSIFTKTCCLLALLSKDSRRASEIRNNPRMVARLQTLFKLTVRKYQMDAQRLRTKENSCAYKNGHCSIPVTPVRIKMVSRQRPAWILRKDNIQEIVNPLQAIEMVLDTLGISCS
uniref:Abnormal spindle-like microcephaly-associated protein isoform X1 n=1 Tax=Pogona vitticeps TaxID=103695 RepID=A0A6J0SHN4_9SAUR